MKVLIVESSYPKDFFNERLAAADGAALLQGEVENHYNGFFGFGDLSKEIGRRGWPRR
jgi:hypothetical protein